MNRLQLIEEVREVLSKAGFYLSKREYQDIMPFDIIARRDDRLFVISISVNADSSRMRDSEQLKILNDALDASPLFISCIGGQRKLKQGVVYSRKGIPLMSPETFKDMVLEGIPPYVFSAPGGLYVKMNSDLLKKARKEKKIPLSRLADVAGVSRKSIQKYEDGMGADLEVALRLQEFLGEDLILPINPFEREEYTEEYDISLDQYSGLEKIIFKSLLSIGYRIVPTCECPFEAITEDEDKVFLSGVGAREDRGLKKKAKIVSNLSDVTEKDPVIFLHKKSTRMNIEGIPLIEKDELSKIDDKAEVSELLTERKD
ncbi:MAG: transcriptional regulator [Candidatus Thermoplasmatota archaeon]|nr:transcriptional regulator [Candidatus Thermoplasmatota archaeon]MBS3789396.1 transcriptional regulator [Candidatus Thermoplasmatota archaeon]